MAVSPKVFSESVAVANTATTYVQAELGRKMIDKCTAYNSDTTSRTLTVHLLPSGGTAATSTIILVKTLQPGETYTCPEVVGHVLEPSGFLQALASTASVINLRISGRVVS